MSDKERPGLREQAFCLGLAELLIEPLREVAKLHGYALGLHGSRRRDIDLIAAPWAEEASPPRVLAEAIQAKTEELAGHAFNVDRQGAANPDYFDNGMPGFKPHGRLCWSFHVGGGPYLDLSVLPPWPEPYRD